MDEYLERRAAVMRLMQDGCSAKNVQSIMELPAASVSQWISVKDRLPEAEQEVLVISRGWGDRLLYVGQYKKMEAQTSPLTGITSKESDWLLWGWSYMKKPQVTHWMPLPEPPKGDADNG